MIISVTLNASIDKLYVVDSLSLHTLTRVREVNNTAGGKGMNVARVAALAGVPVTAMGFIGGHMGGYFESLIDTPGLTPCFTHIQNETRSCLNVFEKQNGLNTEILEPGAAVSAAEMERFVSDFSAKVPEAELVTISGSMPAGLPVDFYQRLIRIARTAGKGTILDTSGSALCSAVTARPMMIKPNTDEIRQLSGHAIDSFDALVCEAKRLRQSGIPYVVISLGAEGALLVCEAGVFHGRPPKIQVVNAVGCGDSMVAGFACGLVRHMSAEEMLRYAIAISAANALTESTGSFRQSDLDELSQKVEIRSVT